MTLTANAKHREYQAHKERIDHLLLESVVNDDVSNIKRLEKSLADYVDAEDAIVCNSQFNAFILIFMVLGLKAGDEVITSPLASGIAVQAALFMEAKIIFTDVDPASYTLDVEQVEDAITERTKLIIPVSLFGNIANMQTINDLALQHDLCVIEDAAESFGTQYQGKKSAQLSKLSTCSFHPSMPLHGFGNGAALFIQDKELREKARRIRSQGKENNLYTVVGIEACMDQAQAAVVDFKLSVFDEEVNVRKDFRTKYTNALDTTVYQTPLFESNSNAAYFPIEVKEPLNMIERFKGEGITLTIPFEMPLHLHPAFSFMDYKKGDFPVAERLCDTLLLLPLSAYMSEEEQADVIKLL